MNIWRIFIIYLLVLFGIFVFLIASFSLSGCTHGGSGGSKISHQPAVIMCFLANCETELADRTAAPLEQDESAVIEPEVIP